MSDPSADSIETIGSLPGGVTFVFPSRSLGSIRQLAWGLLLIALAIAYWVLAGPTTALWRNGFVPFDAFLIVFRLALLAGFLGLPVSFACKLLFGHLEVTVRPDRLEAGERGLLFKRTKAWPLAGLARLQVVDALPNSQGEARFAILSHLHALTGVMKDGTRIPIVLGYPRGLLTSFAEQLSTQIAVALRDAGGSSSASAAAWDAADKDPQPNSSSGTAAVPSRAFASAPRVSTSDKGEVQIAPATDLRHLVEETKQKQGAQDVFEQPPGSQVRIDSFPEGTTLRVPPAGVWKGSAGLFPFGILWSIGMCVFTALFVGSTLAQGASPQGWLGLCLFMGLFWAVGAAMLWFGWNMGRRESVIAVVPASLMVLQTGARRSKRREFSREDIETVCVGPSGMEVNDVPVPELQIIGANKKLCGLLAGRDPQELAWMATMLRQALNTPEQPDATDPTAAETEPVSLTKRLSTEHSEEKFDYTGMTIDERLKVARLSDDFADAVARGDQATLVDLLCRVNLPETGAAAYADSVLANPRQYGYEP